jgi:hypothetical protein
MVERRFAGDPVIKETGVGDGKAAPAPLTVSQQRTTVEMLNQDGDQDDVSGAELRRKPSGGTASDDESDDLDEADELAPSYSRERIGSRIGLPPEEANSVEVVENELDHEMVVPCMFQKEVRVNDRGLAHVWGPGIHLVPVSLAGDGTKAHQMHFYLRAHRVKRTGKPQARLVE